MGWASAQRHLDKRVMEVAAGAGHLCVQRVGELDIYRLQGMGYQCIT